MDRRPQIPALYHSDQRFALNYPRSRLKTLTRQKNIRLALDFSMTKQETDVMLTEVYDFGVRSPICRLTRSSSI